jgi:hypothetical protein
MKFTSEDLMKAMGLQVGNRVKVFNDILEVQIKDNEAMLVPITDTFTESVGVKNVKFIAIGFLVDKEYKILPRQKRVGELKCEDFNDCNKCPLQFVCNLYDCPFSEDNSLYNILIKMDVFDQEIYDLIKARLDKEVE